MGMRLICYRTVRQGFETDLYVSHLLLTDDSTAVSSHYDISNQFFQSFLSADMTYSCPLYSDAEGGPVGDPNDPTAHGLEMEGRALYSAQIRKLRHILKLARVRKGDRVLEIGTGWGSLAIEAAKLGASVETLTLSREQKRLAEDRIAAEKFENGGSVRVHLMDCHDVPDEWIGAFDSVVSIEMVEHLGIPKIPGYFAIVDRCLKPNGVGTFQLTTYPETRAELHKHKTGFIQKWVRGVPFSLSFVVHGI
jgi:cyclopropane-fatty-acyl-phospholipid synthase